MKRNDYEEKKKELTKQISNIQSQVRDASRFSASNGDLDDIKYFLNELQQYVEELEAICADLEELDCCDIEEDNEYE